MSEGTRSKALRKAGVATAAITAGAALAIGGVQFATAKSATATTGVNIRSGPGTSYRIVGGLVRGQSITTVGKASDGWVKVRFNGGAAYISAQYLDTAGTSVSTAPVMIYTQGVKISSAPLNVRQQPALNAKVIGYISAGQQVTLTGKQTQGYAEVLYGGQRAWVSARYLISSTSALPSTTGTRYATADLLIRTSTDADFKIITTAPKGSRLQVTGTTSNGYAQVIYNNAIRWVTAKYLASKAIPGHSATSSRPSTARSTAPKTISKPRSTAVQQSSQRAVNRAPRAIGTRFATTELLVRSTSGNDYNTVATVARGNTVKITGRTSNGRAEIVYNGGSRWVTAQYLSTSRPQSAATNSTSRSGSRSTSVRATSTSSGGVDPSYSGKSRNVSDSTWDQLAMCESSGNWSINTGNGFYGGLQFTLQTWRGFGGTGMPNQASRSEQIRVAERILAVQGWGAWPACSSKLGLR
ncbi:SH3 domain-containing protein [Microlunatus elymi]|uniref:SH3 domain-containing protein n=1 Tax=Microlunatus elymi TaxID=2596828 RepID=UPI00143D22DD|nr:SH3 domain-containing protein [Microlunatus elymi]